MEQNVEAGRACGWQRGVYAVRSEAEIAAALGLSQPRVHEILHNAMGKMSRYLDARGHGYNQAVAK